MCSKVLIGDRYPPAETAMHRIWTSFRVLVDRSSTYVFPWWDMQRRQFRDVINGAEIFECVLGKVRGYSYDNESAFFAPDRSPTKGDVLRCHFRRPRVVWTSTEYVCLIRLLLRTRGGDGPLLVSLKIDNTHSMSVTNVS